MIARHWRGWTRPADADAYETLLRETVLPHLRQLEGHCGMYLLRSDGHDESEFVVINFFNSFDSVKRFSGPDYQIPVLEPEARRLLSRVEPIAQHFEVRHADSLQRHVRRAPSVKINQCRVLRDVIPPTPPGPEGSNGNGLVRAQ